MICSHPPKMLSLFYHLPLLLIAFWCHFLTCTFHHYSVHALGFSFPNPQLYSSALVECEEDEPKQGYRSFDVEAVKKEIFRGRRLVSINYIITYKMNRPLGDAFKRKSI